MVAQTVRRFQAALYRPCGCGTPLVHFWNDAPEREQRPPPAQVSPGGGAGGPRCDGRWAGEATTSKTGAGCRSDVGPPSAAASARWCWSSWPCTSASIRASFFRAPTQATRRPRRTSSNARPAMISCAISSRSSSPTPKTRGATSFARWAGSIRCRRPRSVRHLHGIEALMNESVTADASSRWDYAVAVIGGGPGGSTAATALAQRGRSVVVLERERFPRFHIGESQLPWTNEILLTLGVRDTIAASGFVEKWGASFRGPDGPDERYADFQFARETPSPQTFQVLREKFDEILLRHSEKSGARVLEEHRLVDAAFDSDGVTLSFSDKHGSARTMRVGVV